MKAFLAAALLATMAPAAALPAAKPARAEDARTAEARSRFQKGAQLYREARYREAIAEFQAAYRIKPSGVLHYNIGQSHEKLGETASALASYEAYLREEPRAPNRATVQRAIANLQARLAAAGLQVLQVESDPPGAEVWVDGQFRGRTPLSVALAPGAHAASLSMPGYQAAARDVVLSAERPMQIAFALQPAAAPAPPAAAASPAPPAAAQPPSLAPSPRGLPTEATRPAPAPKPAERKSWLAPVLAGSVAVVAAGAGVAMGIRAQKAANELRGSVHDRASADELAGRASSSATAANVLYGVAGAAALAGGGILVFGGYF